MATLNKTPKYNFAKICRACLQIKKDMRPLFEQLTATMLMDISKVQVSVGDGLPLQLCLQCVHQISRCHAFKEMVEKNDGILHEQAKAVAEETLKINNQMEMDKALSLNCGDSAQFIKFMEVPPLGNNPNQILDGFFTDTVPEQTVTQEVLQKNEFDVDKMSQPPSKKEKEDDVLNSDEENYLQMVVFQGNSAVGPGQHVCNLCHKKFKHARWLKLHMHSHTNWIKANCKKPPMCAICDRTFKGPGMLKMHMRTHEQRPPKPPTCSVCQRVFPSKTLLYRHRQTHFEQKTHHCTVCEKRFYSGYALRSHMARHRGERPYVCAICSKSFYNPTDLKVHFRLHTGEKPLKCSECNKSFRRHSTLCQHMKKHRGIRNHICDVCNKAFYEVSKLNAHMRVHTGERPFSCQFCDRKFAQQSALIYHRRTHTGEKPYACKLCPARFTTSSARNNHLHTHTGHKKFVCPVCFKGCTSRTELRVHSSKHTGEKLFACEVCGQRFSSPSYLAVHRRVHTGEKKYECAVCGKGFIESNSYKRHIKTHEVKDEAEPQVTADPEPTKEDDEDKQQTKVEITIDGENQLEDPIAIQTQEENGTQKKYKCGLCVKSYMYLHSLKKHMLSHVQMCVVTPDGTERLYFRQQQQDLQQQQQQQHQQQQHQQQQQQQHQQQQQQQQHVQLQQQQVQQLQQQVLQVGGVQQLTVPIHAQHMQPAITVSGIQGNQQYPVISSVQSVQLQQTHHINTQPQHLQLQTIQIHPQHQPIQIHAVGVQQVQQEQLHVATSSCQSMLPNILQLGGGAVAVSGLTQELGGGVGGGVHRIILQQPATPSHPALYTIHH